MDELTHQTQYPESEEHPMVYVKFRGQLVGRIVNNLTGDTTKVLVVFRQYKGSGPVFVSAINPEEVVQL